MRCTVVSRVIDAPPETVYRAFLDRDALVAWLPPGSMTGVIHTFEPREGGTFRISLAYPEDDTSSRGKSSARADTVRGRFVRLIPNEKIVWATEFEIDGPVLRRRDDRALDLGAGGQRHKRHGAVRENPGGDPAGG